MNVLQLCHRVPFPANDGGNIAMISLADSLISQSINLKMLTLNTKKHEVNLNSISEKIRSKYHLESVPIDTDIRPLDAFLNLFSSESYNVKRFYSTEFKNKLSEVLRATVYNVVLIESIFMAPYIDAIRRASSAKIILRSHNVEHIIWQRLAMNEKNLLKQSYLSLLTKRLKSFEIEIINTVDAILPITVDDEKQLKGFGCKVPMQVTPVGIDTSEYPDQVNEQSELSLFHLGSMDWRPNLEGVQWFLNDCWKMIHEKFPTLKLFLAGRGFPQSLMEREDANVKCEGEILDAQEFMRGKQIMIVPLKSGGGMRVKIIQGMALGKTIISTTIGAEGINYTDGKNILIADTAQEILLQLQKCLNDKSFCFSIGQEARNLIGSNYSNDAIGKSVVDFLKKN